MRRGRNKTRNTEHNTRRAMAVASTHRMICLARPEDASQVWQDDDGQDAQTSRQCAGMYVCGWVRICVTVCVDEDGSWVDVFWVVLRVAN